MEIIKHICDRCKKEIPIHNCRTAFLKVQTEMVGAGIRVKGNYLLCDECANDFADRFLVLTKDEAKGGE